MALVGAMLGENFRISFTSAILNEPGKARDTWHADWPFNQQKACRVPSPYPDAIMHITTLFMLSPFTAANGGTLVVPGSHRSPGNPTGKNGVEPTQPYPTEYRVLGEAGSVLVFDSRLWHCSPANPSKETRVALAVRYAPWWLNLEVLRPGSEDRKRMVENAALSENVVPPIPQQVFEKLPAVVQPLLRHWIARSGE